MSGKYSVLYFTNSTLWGGVEEHISGLLCRLSRRLFRPHLICAPATFERFRAACPDDVVIWPLPLLNPARIGAAAQLARILMRERFHIVHCHMFWSSLCASPIAWACGVPVIVETLHGSEAWRTGWKANCTLDRAVTRLVSQYIAVCNHDAEFLANRKRVPYEKIAIIHNGVDTRRFSKLPGSREAIRQALGFTEDDLILIMVARFHPGKGHRVLLDAMRRLLPAFPKLKLICLGEGEGEIVRSVSGGLNHSQSIHLGGYQTNVAEWFQAADINVLPSFYEGLPLTVLEAMASAVPTVATHVGGIVDAIEDGVGGILVPPGSSLKLAEAISFLLSDADMRKRMGDAARARVVQRFTIDQQICSTERIYLDLCGAPERDLDDARAAAQALLDERASSFATVECEK